MDDIKFILIYASKKYLNFMDKYKAKDYLKNRADLLNEYKKYNKSNKVLKYTKKD